jgi:phosphoglycolate phosphatase-like HAD superfamily hydrolase
VLNAAARALVATLFVACATSACAADWVYFDVGETLVTASGDDAYRLVPDATARLDAVAAGGFEIGLISNIPAAWGATCREKLAKLQDHLAKGLAAGAAGATFPWTRVHAAILPPEDRYQKPKPYLFTLARAHACPGKALFVGENAAEVAAARDAGLAALQVATGELPTVDQMKAALAAAPAGCAPAPRPVAALLPGDTALDGRCLEAP